jgi:hypothetical protein
MTTVFTSPTIFSQYAEEGGELEHIQWNDNQFIYKKNIDTNGVLTHFARSPKTDIRSKTYYLKAQNFSFNYIPDNISGIELVLDTDRRGRISDDTVQLIIDDQIVGENKANLNLDPKKVYGGPTDLWGLDSISRTQISNVFGVLVRFQSHPHFPHKDGMFIRSIEVRIH